MHFIEKKGLLFMKQGSKIGIVCCSNGLRPEQAETIKMLVQILEKSGLEVDPRLGNTHNLMLRFRFFPAYFIIPLSTLWNSYRRIQLYFWKKPQLCCMHHINDGIR